MTPKSPRQKVIAQTKLLVIKVGSDVLAATGTTKSTCDRRVIRNLAESIAELHRRSIRVVLVSSGAIGQGLAKLQRARRPGKIEQLQAAAAIGQSHLIHLYEAALAKHDLKVGQILLTRSDFENRTRYLNIRHTIDALHKMRAVPIVNENDTVAVEEIRLGDNDILAALLANLLRANLLIFLTTVDGLLKNGQVLDIVDHIDKKIYALDHGRRSRSGIGGMSSKLQAASIVTDAGDAAIIANGKTPKIVDSIMQAQPMGTLFIPAKKRIDARKRWIADAAKPAGTVTVDAGAAQAITKARKSLLPIGITAVKGTFKAHQIVEILTPQGKSIARGRVNYSAAQIRKIKGMNSTRLKKLLGSATPEELIHADHLAIKRI